ncbi:MAG TPA: ABC transporter permease [Chlamydiales bacterium]|jgi:ABC-2 type transport system permease protein|nr:ABC transporter permease [Chlamydiales bacterium]
MSLRRILGVFYRYYYILLKGPQQLSDLFYWPFIDILLWGLTSVWIQSQNPGDTQKDLPLMLLTGLIFWQITWRGSIDVSLSLLQEFWHRNLVNLFSTPLKITEWAAGVILLCLCKLCVTVCFGITVVYFLYSLNILAIGWMFFPFAISLLIFGWTIGFLAASAIIYWGHQVETIAFMVGFVFAPFSAVFYPVSVLPMWTQLISWCLPTTYVFEGMRNILASGTFPLTHLWISLGLNTLYLFLSFSLFQRTYQKSLAKGLARLE